ncbi:MAG: hypothetical protein IKK17_00270 [Oscillospiraceae bacterium]|nr:hypothetical protein [Oscillospiraceae bacterium]
MTGFHRESPPLLFDVDLPLALPDLLVLGSEGSGGDGYVDLDRGLSLGLDFIYHIIPYAAGFVKVNRLRTSLNGSVLQTNCICGKRSHGSETMILSKMARRYDPPSFGIFLCHFYDFCKIDYENEKYETNPFIFVIIMVEIKERS